jgi:hypothetical protein
MESVMADKLFCAQCGAHTDAACECGKEYIPKVELARRTVRDHPELSDRAIAERLSNILSPETISPETVRLARISLGKKYTSGPRTGRDGRTRRQPKYQEYRASSPFVLADRAHWAEVIANIMATVAQMPVEQRIKLIRMLAFKYQKELKNGKVEVEVAFDEFTTKH